MNDVNIYRAAVYTCSSIWTTSILWGIWCILMWLLALKLTECVCVLSTMVDEEDGVLP